MSHAVTSVEQLEAIYGQPHERAVWKEVDHLNEDYQAFVRASPFVVIGSVGEGGTDCSPRGEAAGFVDIVDARTLALPDRPGNNRVDTLRNIVVDPRVSLLFLVPGVGETLRVNGRAEITVDPALLERYRVQGKVPRSVIVVRVDAAFFHCAKAIVRSSLWDSAMHRARETLPSPGAMLKRIAGEGFDQESYERGLAERLRAGLY